jgi:tetratricopeptide (TPR) repeat protein
VPSAHSSDRASSFAQAAALLTLAGGAADAESAVGIFRRWPRLKAKGDDALLGMFDLMGELYPQDDGATGVRPDVLGEHLVDQELSRTPALLGAALAGQSETPLTVLTRLAKRRPTAKHWLEQAFAQDLERLVEPAIRVAIETGDPIGPILAEELERRTKVGELPDYDRLQRLESAIPHQTTALREVGAATMAQMRALLGRVPGPWPEETQIEAARVSNNLANRLSDLGRREAALQAAEEAANLYRELARARPDAFTPALAGSLNNLARSLSELGRREAALQAAEEAAELYRELARARPDTFTPDLAKSLNNLANALSDLGRHEAALQAVEEAAGFYRELARARPDAFTPHLATSLNNLANRLSDLGRREAALEAAEEAVWTLGPPFLALPAAYASWMMKMAQNYIQRCQEVGREPDAELLGRIADALRKMQEGRDTKGAQEGGSAESSGLQNPPA